MPVDTPELEQDHVVLAKDMLPDWAQVRPSVTKQELLAKGGFGIVHAAYWNKEGAPSRIAMKSIVTDGKEEEISSMFFFLHMVLCRCRTHSLCGRVN
jgi:hypothetical protein